MKQVIVRIKDCRATYTKTLAVAHFYSVCQYESEVLDFVKTLMPHQEIQISIGRQYIKYLTYEEIVEYAEENKQTFDDQLFTSLIDDYSIRYELRAYLPRW